jgi:hypothetical protein
LRRRALEIDSARSNATCIAVSTSRAGERRKIPMAPRRVPENNCPVNLLEDLLESGQTGANPAAHPGRRGLCRRCPIQCRCLFGKSAVRPKVQSIRATSGVWMGGGSFGEGFVNRSPESANAPSRSDPWPDCWPVSR